MTFYQIQHVFVAFYRIRYKNETNIPFIYTKTKALELDAENEYNDPRPEPIIIYKKTSLISL